MCAGWNLLEGRAGYAISCFEQGLSGGWRWNTPMHPGEGRLCQCPERFFAYPLLHPPLSPTTRSVQTHFYTRVLFLAILISPFLFFLLLSGEEQPNAGLNEGITAVAARISRNKSTPRFSFSSFFFFFFLFNSFQHLLLVISCLPLRSCLPRSAPSITRRCSANSKKGDDAEKRISKGATRSNCNFVSGKYCAFSGRDGLCCGGKLRETERFHPSPSSQCRSLLSW